MKLFRILAPLCALILTAASSHAQVYKLHNVDISGSAIGQFTTPLTVSNPAIVQNTSNTFGGEFTLREHPVAWAGIELNYAYTELNETYSFLPSGTVGSYAQKVRTDAHEATAAYLFHPHFRKLQPFIAIGGGAIDFDPQVPRGKNQWRSAGLLEAGLDIPTSNPHMGFRIQGRSLIYRTPNYFQPLFASRSWVSTEEPSVGAWYRF